MSAVYTRVSNTDVDLNEISVVDGPNQSLPRQSSKSAVREKTEEERKKERLNTQILNSVQAGDGNQTKSLLQDGASPNASCRESLITVSHIAALKGLTSIFEDLKSSGADLSLRDKYGRQTIHMAAWGGHLDIIESILSKSDLANSKIEVYEQVENDCLDSWNHNHDDLESSMVLDELSYGCTPLHLACKKALTEIVDCLLESGADVNAEDAHGLTPLDVTGISYHSFFTSRIATDSGRKMRQVEKVRKDPVHEIVSNLIRKNAQVVNSPKKRSIKNVTTLHTAVEKEDPGLIDCLLENGASLAIWNSEGDTPIHLAIKKRLSEILQKMVNWSRPMMEVRDKNGKTPLYLAVEMEWFYGVEILLEAGANVAAANHEGETVYHLVAQLGNRAMLEEFLSIDRSQKVLEHRDKKHRTPLFVAVDNNRLSCVQTLCENGASMTSKMPGNITLLHLAACRNSPDIIEFLLNDDVACTTKDSRSDEDRRGLTPLHVAAEKGHVGCVEKLLNGGCDPCLKSTTFPERGVTPLHQAAKNGHLEVVHLIVKREPKTMNIPTEEGWLPLHIAAGYGHSECTRFMIRNGADISENIKDPNHSSLNGLEIILFCMPQPVEFLEEIFDSYLEINGRPLSDPECEVSVKYDLLVPSKSCKQLDVLNAVLNSSNDFLTERILIHPLVEIFLYLKWRKLRIFFMMIIGLYLMLASSLTILAELTYVLKSTDTIFMVCAEVARSIMFLSLAPIIIIEIINASQQQRYYVYDYESWVKWAVICSTTIIGTSGIVDPSQEWARYLTSIATLLSWIELLFLLAHFPIWGYYVLMFSKVAKNLLKVMGTFSFLFVGFTFAFLILFEGNSPFRNFFEAVLKVIVMMLELEYDDTFQNEKEVTPLSIIGRFMFVIFLLLVSVVMMNLMVGVAVSDITKLEEQGRALKMAKQTAFLSLIESVVNNTCLEKVLPKGLCKSLNSRRSPPDVTIIKPAKSMHYDRNPVPKSLRDAVLVKVRDSIKKIEKNEENANMSNLRNKIDILTDIVTPRKISDATSSTVSLRDSANFPL